MVDFGVWNKAITMTQLGNEHVVRMLRDAALQMAVKAEAQADAAATANFRSWLNDGPARGLGRQHKFSRTRVGWIPSPTFKDESDHGGDDDEAFDDGMSLEVMRSCKIVGEGSSGCVGPMSEQQLVEMEAVEWGKQWDAWGQYPAMDWPAEIPTPVREITMENICDACMTFPSGTGLGLGPAAP
jgi:hypothetical protein